MSRKEKAIDFAKSLISRFRDDDVPSLGAQLSYYLVLSFFPFLIFLVSVVGFLHMNTDKVLSDIVLLLPSDSANSIRTVIDEARQNRSGALLSVGMLGTLWAASNGVNAIIKGLNKAYDEEEDRPFWKVRGISIIATVVLALVIWVSMLTLVFGKVIGEYLFQWMNYPAGFELIWGILKFAIPLAAMFGVFLLLYWLAPNRRLTWREVIPGSIFTTLGWIISSLLFSFYVNNISNYTKTYGSLGGIIVLLIWLYLSSIIIVLGGEVNATAAFGNQREFKRSSKTYAVHVPWMKRKAL
jgi:membrane protein